MLCGRARRRELSRLRRATAPSGALSAAEGWLVPQEPITASLAVRITAPHHW